MRYTVGMRTLVLVAFLLLAVVAALGWLRPVRVVRVDERTAQLDSLARLVSAHQLSAAQAERAADQWRALATELARKRMDVPAAIGNAQRTLHRADLDSLRAVLMNPPEP
jgi:lipopolysaccharide biosynthesis regulator YciM